MDEESRGERIVPGPSSPFPQRKVGSKGCPEISAEARLLQGGTTALESEGIALPAGYGSSHKTGGGQAFLMLFRVLFKGRPMWTPTVLGYPRVAVSSGLHPGSSPTYQSARFTQFCLWPSCPQAARISTPLLWRTMVVNFLVISTSRNL